MYECSERAFLPDLREFSAPYGRLPVIGHLWRLNSVKPFETIDYWSREYGDIFSVFFGTQRVIVISRARLMRDAFLKQADNFSGRPTLFVHESCWGRGHIISDGDENTEMRKFLSKYLRQSMCTIRIPIVNFIPG
ncbi:unnamed protein product [Anisakis simplex]|uniref:Cytochrome P450 n=1 Tax=Anisakis simplex TaxID=6269 RepID=A0A0M3IZ52_ANISI|nr:unnamed protein product [Anisakis simplex]